MILALVCLAKGEKIVDYCSNGNSGLNCVCFVVGLVQGVVQMLHPGLTQNWPRYSLRPLSPARRELNVCDQLHELQALKWVLKKAL